MRPSRLIFALFFLLFAGLPVPALPNSADSAHLHVQLVAPESNLFPAGRNDLGLYFKLEPGWHIYWKNAGDSGEPPHIHWTLPDGVTAGTMEFPAPQRLPLGPLMDFGYEGEVLFPLQLHVAKTVKPGPAVLHAKVDWLVCREVCIPGKAELEETLRVSPQDSGLASSSTSNSDAALFKRLANLLPTPLPQNAKAVFQLAKDGFRLAVVTGRRETTAAFFPADQDILDNPAPQKLTSTANGLILDLKKDPNLTANLTANVAQLKGVLELSGGRAFDLTALPGAVAGSAPASSVFSIQLSSAASAIQPPAPAASAARSTTAPPFFWGALLRTSGLAFLGGLLLNLMPCVFPVLFLKGLALVHSGHKELHKLRAHGMVYAAGILVSFWVLVAVLLGLRAAGATLGWGFQFQSPVFLALMAGLLFFLGLSLAGQFEIGLTLTGAGDSLARKHGYTGSFFTGVLAVVVATPCTAPFMGAAIGYALAQPTAVTFAVFTALALGLAAPYVALTLQPAWTRLLPKPGAWMEVLRQAVSVPIFATVIWLAWVLTQAYGAGILASLLVGFLLLAIAGWFLGRWPAKRWATAVAALILLGVIAIGVCAPSRLAVASETQAAAETQGRGEPHWEPWSAEAVSRYQAQGRPVFVDFTASWCLSCQVNERVALHQPEVQKEFGDRKVALLRADWTRHDEAITQALTWLGRSGVPAYALYAPGQSEPQMLPEVLTPGIVTDALKKLPRPATQTASVASSF
jgi:thiol:disulfide interchange protein DsbD